MKNAVGINFYAVSKSGVNNCVLAFKQGQNLQKIVYFLPILALKSAFSGFRLEFANVGGVVSVGGHLFGQKGGKGGLFF